MTEHLRRSITEPITNYWLSFEGRWYGPDKGIIVSWECGRRLRDEKPDLAISAETGELVQLPWKGGTWRIDAEKLAKMTKEQKAKPRFGCLYYLAMWQGLRGQDLDVIVDGEQVLCCSRTKLRVLFVPDPPDEPDALEEDQRTDTPSSLS